MTLDQFQDLKRWHNLHAGDRPLEGHAWNAVLTLWLVGWVGSPAAWLLGNDWLAAGGIALLLLPGAYVALRQQLHRHHMLRCDWIDAVRLR
jgi:hypothetical protein